MVRSLTALLVLSLAACTSPAGGAGPADVMQDLPDEVAVDGGAEDVEILDTGPSIPWEPGPPDPALVVEDPPFLQEFNHTWNEAEWGGALVALVEAPAAWDWDRPTLVTPRGVLLHADEGFVEVSIPEEHEDLVDATVGLGAVYLAGPRSLYRLDADGAAIKVAGLGVGHEIHQIQGDPTGVDLMTSNGFRRWDGVVSAAVTSGGGVTASLRVGDRLYLASPDLVMEVIEDPDGGLLFPSRTENLDLGDPVGLFADVTLPEPLDFVLVGTHGIAGYQGVGDVWERVDVPLFETERIPLAHARRTAPDPGGGFVVAADGGAYRLVDQERGPEWRVYVPERWMPDGACRDVLPVDDGAFGELWFATAGGPGWVTRTMWTLAEKTAPMVQRIVARHDRDGAIADSRLMVAGDLSTSIPWDSDNDGGWTCYWVLAECLRWKLTGDPEARAHFDRSLERMLSFRTLTGTDWFLARSVIRIEGCQLDDCDGPDDGEWFLSPDGEWWVKADTSNDEVTSHMFMMGQAHDLCADEKQKEAIAAHVAGIVGGIMDHGWQLVDPQDMEPTSYGQFDPFYVNDWPAGAWADGGRRSAQIMGALNLAHYLTGEQRFLDGKAELIEEHHYDENVANVGDAEIYPFCAGSGDCDELALQAFVPLLRYEADPALREMWLTGWRRMWEHLRLQEDLYWEIPNAVFTGKDMDLPTGMRWFRRYPTDLIRFPMHNAPRQDLVPAPDYYLVKDPDREYRVRSDGHNVPPDERPNSRHNTPQFSVNGGWGANREMDDADVLWAYWLGRYHGLIAPPATL